MIYELKIDTDGDLVADIAYRLRFSSAGESNQTATVRRLKALLGRVGARPTPG